jgi:GNAT superfamily N-acetyltransferase
MQLNPTSGKSGFRIREIDAASPVEIDLVVRRMLATILEVEGEERGRSLHSLEWLRQRLLWHIEGEAVMAKVFVADDRNAGIVGHTIVRGESDGSQRQYGWFSTTYVVPDFRRRGIAQQLLVAGEQWISEHGLTRAVTSTSAANEKLIGLFQRNGYRIFWRGNNEATGTPMVALERHLPDGDT